MPGRATGKSTGEVARLSSLLRAAEKRAIAASSDVDWVTKELAWYIERHAASEKEADQLRHAVSEQATAHFRIAKKLPQVSILVVEGFMDSIEKSDKMLICEPRVNLSLPLELPLPKLLFSSDNESNLRADDTKCCCCSVISKVPGLCEPIVLDSTWWWSRNKPRLLCGDEGRNCLLDDELESPPFKRDRMLRSCKICKSESSPMT